MKKYLAFAALLILCICCAGVLIAASAVTSQSQAVEVSEAVQEVVEIWVVATPTDVPTMTPTNTVTPPPPTKPPATTKPPVIKTVPPPPPVVIVKPTANKPVASKTPVKPPPQPSPTPTLPPSNVKNIKAGGSYTFDIKFVGKADVGVVVLSGDKSKVSVEIWANDQNIGEGQPKGRPVYDSHMPQYDFFWTGGSGQRNNLEKLWHAVVINDGANPVTVKFTGQGVGGALTQCFSYWEWIGPDLVYWTECNPDRLPTK